MVRYRPAWTVLIVLALSSALLPTAQAQHVGSGTDRSHRAGASNVHYFAVMGEVKWPAVYEINRRLPRLIDVIRQAGGLTSPHNSSTWIVRHGGHPRPAYATDILLQPNDVVVVVGGSSDNRNGFSFPKYEPRASADASLERRSIDTAASGEDIQVALVNLIDRPVVLMNVRPGYQTLETLVASLGQLPSVAGTVEVLKPAGLFRSGNRHGSSGRLASGSVLIFDPSTIQSDLIPDLPPTIRGEIPTAPAATGHSPYSHVADARQRHENHNDSPVTAPVQAAGVVSAPLAEPFAPIHTDPQPEFLQAPSSDQPSVNEPAVDESRAAIGKQQTTFTDAMMHQHQSHRSQSAVNRTDEPSTTALAASKSQQRSIENTLSGPAYEDGSSGSSLVVIVAGLSMLVLIVLAGRTDVASRIRLRALPRPRAKRSRSALEALINNELPIAEEPCEIPGHPVFFGKPTGARQSRIDAAHPVAGPHIPTRAANSENASTLRGPHVVAATPSNGKSASEKRRVDSAAGTASDRDVQPGVLERALSQTQQTRQA